MSTKRLTQDICNRLDQEEHRSRLTVDEIASAVCEALDSRLCDWVGETEASAWWRRWAREVAGERAPVREDLDDAA